MSGDSLRRVQKVASTVFGCREGDIGYETTAADIDGWDSLSHTVLIVSLEREFSIRFDLARVVQFATMGDVIREIELLGS